MGNQEEDEGSSSTKLSGFSGETTAPNESPPCKKKALDALFGDSFTQRERKSTSETARAEVIRYRAKDALPLTENAMKWWRSQEKELPVLSTLAKRYVCIPGTSVPAERVFISTMVCCAAWGCSNRSEKAVRMYGFPADMERRKKWLAQADFEANQFVMTKNFKSRLRPDAIPTIFVHRPVVKKRRAPAPRCTPSPFQRLREKRDEDTQRRESDSEEREDMAREERQGQVDGLADLERECVLSLDEMVITPSVELHMLTGKLYGDVTLPGHTGVATHDCVFMLAGNTTRWKQVVAYHYIGNSTKGAEYKPIITEIIERAASIGLHVLDVTPNQAMWKSFGVDHTKTSVPHPTTPDRCLYFMPDVPHLVKNLKSALVRGQVLTIPEYVVNKENLPSNEVSVVPIKDLLSFQEGMAFKLAPHLSVAAIEPSHFEKIKVGPALNVFSKATSAGLKYMVQQENRPLSYLTTAWFLEQVDHWFDLMSSRHPITALSRVKMEEYEKAIIFLQDFIHLFHGMKIGHKGVWKPVQTGVIMATKSVLGIQEEMLERGHRFVLTSRFTQDCLENTFSCVRSKNPIPTPVEFHHALRIISVGQFLTTIRSGSYQEDDSSFLADFLDTVKQNVTPSVRVEQLMVENRTAPDLTKTEKCILFHLAGYIVHKLTRFANICGKCKTATRHTDDNPAGDNSILVNLRV
ncbi:unnamed protein product [Leuciscus chuanchicus]